MSHEMAREILKLGFTSTDHARMSFLSAKAQEGSINDSEQEELDGYINVSHLLALLQSKARHSLKGDDPHASAA